MYLQRNGGRQFMPGRIVCLKCKSIRLETMLTILFICEISFAVFFPYFYCLPSQNPPNYKPSINQVIMNFTLNLTLVRSLFQKFVTYIDYYNHRNNKFWNEYMSKPISDPTPTPNLMVSKVQFLMRHPWNNNQSFPPTPTLNLS
jgi:hypothetical protein